VAALVAFAGTVLDLLLGCTKLICFCYVYFF